MSSADSFADIWNKMQEIDDFPALNVEELDDFMLSTFDDPFGDFVLELEASRDERGEINELMPEVGTSCVASGKLNNEEPGDSHHQMQVCITGKKAGDDGRVLDASPELILEVETSCVGNGNKNKRRRQERKKNPVEVASLPPPALASKVKKRKDATVNKKPGAKTVKAVQTVKNTASEIKKLKCAVKKKTAEMKKLKAVQKKDKALTMDDLACIKKAITNSRNCATNAATNAENRHAKPETDYYAGRNRTANVKKLRKRALDCNVKLGLAEAELLNQKDFISECLIENIVRLSNDLDKKCKKLGELERQLPVSP